MDRTAEKVIELFVEKMSTLAEKYGPDAVALALDTARIGALQHLLVGAIGMLVLAVCVVAAPKMYRKGRIAEEKKEALEEIFRGSKQADHEKNFRAWREAEDGTVYYIASVVFTALAIPGLGSMLYLFNAFAWAGVFDPRIWLAQKILNL